MSNGEEKKAGEVAVGDEVMTLDGDSLVNEPSFVDMRVKTTTKGPEAAKMYLFKLKNGTTLEVSQNHGMVLSTGKMTTARNVTLKDRFITYTGEEVAISSINRRPIEGDVVNFETDSDDLEGHVVVAEEILAGDLGWQNQLAAELENIKLRTKEDKKPEK